MSRPSQRPANGQLHGQSHPTAQQVSGCGGASPGCLVPLTSSSSSTTPVSSEHQALLPAVPASPKHCEVFSNTCALLPVPSASSLMQLPGKAILSRRAVHFPGISLLHLHHLSRPSAPLSSQPFPCSIPSAPHNTGAR